MENSFYQKCRVPRLLNIYTHTQSQTDAEKGKYLQAKRVSCIRPSGILLQLHGLCLGETQSKRRVLLMAKRWTREREGEERKG